MRIIDNNIITETVKKMCINANCYLNDDIKSALSESIETEKSNVGKNVLSDLLKNAEIASKKEVPICQDTGMAVFFVEIGEEVHINGNITHAINEGVRQGYTEGFLRKSSPI